MLDDSLHLAAVKQIERPLPNPTGGANSRVGCSGIKCAAINGNASCMMIESRSIGDCQKHYSEYVGSQKSRFRKEERTASHAGVTMLTARVERMHRSGSSLPCFRAA